VGLVEQVGQAEFVSYPPNLPYLPAPPALESQPFQRICFYNTTGRPFIPCRTTSTVRSIRQHGPCSSTFAEIGLLERFEDGQFDRYFDRLYDYFATAAGWIVYPDVVPALEHLKRHGFIVGLITNFDSRVFRLIDALDLARFIDSITIPALAGAAKPEAGIFEYALARHGLRAGEAVQIGDSMEDDVEAACTAGLQGVLIDRKGRTRAGSGLPFDVAQGRQAGTDVVLSIRSLEELPRLLGLHE